jgi:hypothetical protein
MILLFLVFFLLKKQKNGIISHCRFGVKSQQFFENWRVLHFAILWPLQVSDLHPEADPASSSALPCK